MLCFGKQTIALHSKKLIVNEQILKSLFNLDSLVLQNDDLSENNKYTPSLANVSIGISISRIIQYVSFYTKITTEILMINQKRN